MELSADYRIGNHAGFLETKHPAWDDVETAIRNLDQDSHTEVTLAKNDEHYLGVGGGNGVFLVFIWRYDHSLLPFNPSLPDQLGELVSGGQAIVFSKRHLVGLDDALVAAKHYYETGEASPMIRWLEET